VGVENFMKKQHNKQIRTYSHTKKHQISEQTLNNIQKPLKTMTEGTMTGMLSQYLGRFTICFREKTSTSCAMLRLQWPPPSPTRSLRRNSGRPWRTEASLGEAGPNLDHGKTMGISWGKHRFMGYEDHKMEGQSQESYRDIRGFNHQPCNFI